MQAFCIIHTLQTPAQKAAFHKTNTSKHSPHSKTSKNSKIAKSERTKCGRFWKFWNLGFLCRCFVLCRSIEKHKVKITREYFARLQFKSSEISNTSENSKNPKPPRFATRKNSKIPTTPKFSTLVGKFQNSKNAKIQKTPRVPEVQKHPTSPNLPKYSRNQQTIGLNMADFGTFWIFFSKFGEVVQVPCAVRIH